MRIIIAGSRSFDNYRFMCQELDRLTAKLDDIVVISGGAKGADKLAERWAFENCFPREIHHAEWKKYGKSAGPRRNEEMIQAGANALIAFWDGISNGTQDIIQRAKKHKIKVRIIRFD